MFFNRCENLIKKNIANYFSIKTQHCIISTTRIIIIIIIINMPYASMHHFLVLHKISISSINTEHEKVHHHWLNGIQKLLLIMKTGKFVSTKKTCINIPKSIHFPTLCLRFKMDFFHQNFFFGKMNFQLFPRLFSLLSPFAPKLERVTR